MENRQGEEVRVAILCALLHDIIEDTDCSAAEIKELFGDKVREGVMALTKNETLKDKEQKMKDSIDKDQRKW
ncbi:MAG: hypothetical protein R2795_00870 [Saprospiraceae bacterium]